MITLERIGAHAEHQETTVLYPVDIGGLSLHHTDQWYESAALRSPNLDRFTPNPDIIPAGTILQITRPDVAGHFENYDKPIDYYTIGWVMKFTYAISFPDGLAVSIYHDAFASRVFINDPIALNLIQCFAATHKNGMTITSESNGSQSSVRFNGAPLHNPHALTGTVSFSRFPESGFWMPINPDIMDNS